MPHPPVEAGADHVHAHPHRLGVPWLDLCIALTAIVISAISLGVAVEHGRTERELVASNAWPFLRELRTNAFTREQEIALGVSNGGVGPAKLRYFELIYRGAPVSTPFELLRRCCGLGVDEAAIKRQLPGGFQYSAADGTVMRPGEVDAVFKLARSDANAAVFDRLNASLGSISFRACYCSILDQCWQSGLQSVDPRPVKRCERPAVPYRPVP